VKSPSLKRLIDSLLQGYATARGQALDAAQLRCGQSDGEYGNLLACCHACILAMKMIWCHLCQRRIRVPPAEAGSEEETKGLDAGLKASSTMSHAHVTALTAQLFLSVQHVGKEKSVPTSWV